jgi:predicted TIM-barrel fold metal-dependent hydrolase
MPLTRSHSHATAEWTSERTRREVDHPVIDADGHVLEVMSAVEPYLREALGPKGFDRYREQSSPHRTIMVGGGDTQRSLRTRSPQSAWWGTPARNTRDLATAALPQLMYDRLDEFGIDYAVLYGTKALGTAGMKDGDLRRGLCRGFNDYYAETWGPFSDRLAPAGIIPIHTPEEAIAELEHCKEIGLKVIALPEGVMREIPEPEHEHPSPFLMPGQTHWFDTFGLDSAYDYDPVWQKCEELGFAATCHGGVGCIPPYRFTSPTNYSYNHIGSFMDSMHRLVKSLFLGGVTRRFPNLSFGVLECGVGWASILLADLVEHWEKRSLEGLAELDPAAIDWSLLTDYARKYGGARFANASDEELRNTLETLPAVGRVPENLDDWRFLEVESEQELVSLFADHFYFGCESDDRTLAFAFSKANPARARLRPIFSSDLSHWDVTDMAGVVTEAHGLVRKELLSPEDFRDFVCRNPARMFTAQNPGFFDGTVLESRARELTQ